MVGMCVSPDVILVGNYVRHSGMRQPNSGLPEFGNIIVQVGNSQLGCAGPESILIIVVMDSGLALRAPE